tara:strand:+ start:305 stop:622 length:318 start_codon:yes stop_codon:yes gene_type:complete
MKRILINEDDDGDGVTVLEVINPGEPESPEPPGGRWIDCAEDAVWFDWTWINGVCTPPTPYQQSAAEAAGVARQVALKAIQEDLINAPEHAERPEVIDYKDKRIS